MIQLQNWKNDPALEMRHLTELHSAPNFASSWVDKVHQSQQLCKSGRQHEIWFISWIEVY